MKKLIIAGGRDFNDSATLIKEVEKLLPIDEIVSGVSRGADVLGLNYGIANNINVSRFPADWDKYGRAAGYIRNKEMAGYATDCICFWDGKSKGTKHMIDLASAHKLNLTVIKY